MELCANRIFWVRVAQPADGRRRRKTWNITPLGIDIGPAGWGNFSQVFTNPNLPGILVRTLVWVVTVVALTMLLSLGLAQLFNQRFPGRRIIR